MHKHLMLFLLAEEITQLFSTVDLELLFICTLIPWLMGAARFGEHLVQTDLFNRQSTKSYWCFTFISVYNRRANESNTQVVISLALLVALWCRFQVQRTPFFAFADDDIMTFELPSAMMGACYLMAQFHHLRRGAI